MNAEFARTLSDQLAASDPYASAWVSANAGAGKTHVLTLRVVRLLLEGAAPERILCLTYTKAAAAEMSKRVFDTLSRWVTMSDADLVHDLSQTLARTPDSDDIKRARNLFARTIETPGGLKVQTIHAFAEKLLQRFPLEAGVTPGFKILDDGEARQLKARAIDSALTEATTQPSSSIGQALFAIIRFTADANFDVLLSKAIDQRQWLDLASRLEFGEKSDDFSGAEALLRHEFGLSPEDSEQSLDAERAGVLSEDALRACAETLRTGSKTDGENADILDAAARQPDHQRRAALLQDWFLTGKGEPRKNLFGAASASARPDLVAKAAEAQRTFHAATEKWKGATLVAATTALYRMAGAVLQRYADAKQMAGALDFEDLISRTTNLLTGRKAADWVLFKLDGGLDHILLDEAQDTGPEQWAIVEALAREFFAGDGARDNLRTLFAVGDEKQSIYSFQGAAPDKFAEMGALFARLATEAARSMRRVPLNLSFRSVESILQAVDGVFQDSSATPGLTITDPVRHTAFRKGQPGLVELWPVEQHDAAEPGDPWRPLDDGEAQVPAIRLANRIAAKIDGWLQSGETLASEARRITPGDILILVRKRRPFAAPMVAALKRRGIAVAGADRMTLIDQIAVQDLMALGDFLTLPEDDLALASVLKSPMFALDDDDLLRIAHGRKGALWKALLANKSATEKLSFACETLIRWRGKADYAPPFEFFSSLLDRDGMRSRLLHRLGPDAADAIDEFLDAAIAFDDRNAPSMTGFLAALRAEKADVKRDMDLARNEVRVMTVHGAKGLEAPIVFLPDTCTTASGENNAARLLALPIAERPAGLPAPVIWPVKGASKHEAVQRASQAARLREAEERNRLLYVAMTRAKDRLYVAGYDGVNGRPTDCWYAHIERALKSLARPYDDGDERTVMRIETPKNAQPEKPKFDARQTATAIDPPDFARRRAKPEPLLTVPLAPSRLEPYAPDAEGEPVLPRATLDPAAAGDGPSPRAAPDSRRFLRGTLTHALLQRLPEIEPEKRRSAAEAFVARRGQPLLAAAQRGIVDETLAILEHPDFAPLFGVDSRAEVAVAAVLPRPFGSGPALRLSGQIDRLAVVGDEVFIVDYKTNRPPPREITAVADAYLFQLAAYVLALREIYPGKSIRPALLWTDGPRLMDIPDNVIKDAIRRLWALDLASLDAP